MEDHSSPTCWALLIGINYYPNDDETRPLEGCVRDVEQLQQHLQTRRNVHSILLKASKEDGSEKLSGDEKQWPTMENVRSSVSTIINGGTHGDLVFIHFSGHGVRRKTQAEDFGDHENGDLALVLYDLVSNVTYLQGLELATMLKQMVDKGLKPVLVLDCCYSGAVLRHRHDQQGRTREAVYNAEIDRQSSNPDLSRENLTFKTPKRDANALPNWILDPEGYAILTACGPDEITREITFRDGCKSGALSYFLFFALESMLRHNTSTSLKSLHDYVSVQFHAGTVKQTPRRYGNENICLFNPLGLDYDPLETRVRKQGDELILEAGQVHAVAENDEYRIQAPWNGNPRSTAPIICRVKTVNALSSVIEVVNVDVSMIKTGWRAVPCTHLSNRNIHVELSSRLQQDHWQEEIATSSFLKSSVGLQSIDTPPISGVCIDIKDETEYQILDERMCEISGLPTIPISSPLAISNTVSILDHVAKFKYIERLENRVPNLDFERSIRVQLADSKKTHVVDGMGVLHVSHDEIVELRCLNFSKKVVYLSLLDLRPLWQIENILGENTEVTKNCHQSVDIPHNRSPTIKHSNSGWLSLESLNISVNATM